MRCQSAIASLFALAVLSTQATACRTDPVSLALPELPASTTEALPSRGSEQPVRELTLALVGEVRGEIEPCGCPTLPFGGFSRRYRAIQQLREHGTVFHLDAGELLLKGESTSNRDHQSARSEALLALSSDVGVDAWAPGPSDLLAIGVDGIRALKTPPAVSANWRGADGELLLPPFVVVERDGLRVAVIGLSGTPTDRALAEQVLTIDPVAAASAVVETLPPRLDLVLGLGSIDGSDADRVAALPGIAAVLTTRGSRFDEPRRGAGPSAGLVIEAPDRGRYLEVVTVRLATDPGAPLQALLPDQVWRDRDTELLQGGPEATGAGPSTRAAQIAEVGRGRNLAYAAALPLAAELDGPSPARARIEAFKTASLSRAAARAAEAPRRNGPGYAASAPCLNCHTTEFSRWSLSPHAGAWQPLVDRDSTGNPECLACHSTGFGQAGGFGEPTEANLRKFKAVQCEACHGPLLGHPDDASVSGRPIDERTCLPCHDPANSPLFDYVPYLRRSTCQDADAVDPG